MYSFIYVSPIEIGAVPSPKVLNVFAISMDQAFLIANTKLSTGTNFSFTGSDNHDSLLSLLKIKNEPTINFIIPEASEKRKALSKKRFKNELSLAAEKFVTGKDKKVLIKIIDKI